MSKRSYFAISLFFCLSLFSTVSLEACGSDAGCSDALGCVVISPGDPILIGIESITAGEDIAASKEVNRGAAIAVENLRILDHPVRVFTVQSTCLPIQSQASAAAITSQPKIIAALGPACPLYADVTKKFFSDAGISLIDPAALQFDLSRELEFNEIYVSSYGKHPSGTIAYQAYRAVLFIAQQAQSTVIEEGEIIVFHRSLLNENLQQILVNSTPHMTP